MKNKNKYVDWEEIKKIYPRKFKSERFIFDLIRPGDRIFLGTGCGEPQYLVNELLNYVKKILNPS
jgi:acyl-CoA hydrolase